MHQIHLLSRPVMFSIFVALASFVVAPATTALALDDWHRGASIRSSTPGDYSSEGFRNAVDELASINANYVTLILPWKQADLRASEIYPHWGAPEEEVLVEGIEYAHSQGLQVNLKPHVDEENYAWRARIDPRDPDAWFDSYGQMLLEYAEIAEENNVALITIGSELVRLTGPAHTERWVGLIEDVREVYSGSLTYSANWGGDDWSREKDFIGFWDELDYIGIAAYFNFRTPHDRDSLIQQWQRWDQREIQPLYEEFGKPIVFTEIGYRSVEDALRSPWNWSSDGRESQSTQALAYEALFAYWEQREYFRGIHIWDWKNSEEYTDSSSWPTNYTPQGKEAEAVIADWFGQAAQGEGSTATADESTTEAETAGVINWWPRPAFGFPFWFGGWHLIR